MTEFAFYNECTAALLSSGTLKLMLLQSSYVFNASDYLAVVQANEITATGNYAAGGPDLTNVTWAAPVLDADNVAFNSMTATFQHLVLWNYTSGALLACWTYDDPQVLDNSSVTIEWPETGILTFAETSPPSTLPEVEQIYDGGNYTEPLYSVSDETGNGEPSSGEQSIYDEGLYNDPLDNQATEEEIAEAEQLYGIDAFPDFDAIADIDGNTAGLSSVTAQIAIAGNDGVFGDWQNFQAGSYYGRKFKFRLLLKTTDTNQITPMVESFSWLVDVPDRIESGSANIAAAGSVITYSKPFQTTPAPQITVYDASGGDEIFLTAKTVSGFTVQVKNAGTGVARTIHWMAKAY